MFSGGFPFGFSAGDDDDDGTSPLMQTNLQEKSITTNSIKFWVSKRKPQQSKSKPPIKNLPKHIIPTKVEILKRYFFCYIVQIN